MSTSASVASVASAPNSGLGDEGSVTSDMDAFLGIDQQHIWTQPCPPEHRLISRLLHKRLSRFPPDRWPLRSLCSYLESLFRSDAALDDEQPPALAPAAAAAAAAPPIPAASAGARTAPPTWANSVLAPLEQSPRALRANQCADLLATQLHDWPKMLRIHTAIVHPAEDDDVVDVDVNKHILVRRIWSHREKLGAHIPEFKSIVQADEARLLSLLTATYHQLESRISTYHQHQQHNNALALVLMHLAASWSDSSASRSDSSASRSAEVLSFNSHFASQFDRQYRGRAPARFVELISRLDLELDGLDVTAAKPYFRGTPIVQSSGTGKTRMVLECRHLTPLLYVCFRSADEADSNAKAGFPFPDRDVVHFFRNAQFTHPSLCDLHVACFLGAWFQELAHQLESLTTDAQKFQHLSHLHRFDRNTGLNPDREMLFKTATEDAAATLAATNDVPLANASSDVQIFERYLLLPFLHLDRQLKRVSEHMRSLRDHRGHASASTAAAHTSPIIVAFDECVEMNVNGENKGINPLNSLRRAWHWIGEMKAKHRVSSFWLVLMSTSSSAAHLVEHINAKTSIRAKASAPLPTFVGVGFDALLSEQQSITRAQQAFSFEHVVAYGRPLWSSLQTDSFWPTAILKLLCADNLDVNDASHCYSVMASRLALRLVPTYSLRSAMFATQKLFMDRQVDRHMRIVTHITADASMYVDSPSEPVLAIAASLLMLPSAEQEQQQFVKSQDRLALNTYGVILETFCQRCLHGPDVTLYKGTHGELASRIALMAACDAIKRRQLDHPRQSPIDSMPQDLDHVAIISHAVPVQHLLAGLADLDDRNRAQLRQRIADVHLGALRASSRSATVLGDAMPEKSSSSDWPQAWTHFTHFDVLPEAITHITPEYLWYCWKRGVALQMHHDQHGIDGIVPVFVGRLDQPFTQSAAGANPDHGNIDERHAARYMSYIAWESKNQASAQSPLSDQRKAAKLAGPPISRAAIAPQEEPLTERALISVLFDLGTASAFQEAPRTMRPRLQSIAGQSCPRLVIRGMSDKHAYPCLDELKLRSIFSKILTTTAGVGSHEQLNMIPEPMWNAQVQPRLASISGAQDQEQEQQQHLHAQVSMDLD